MFEAAAFLSWNALSVCSSLCGARMRDGAKTFGIGSNFE